MEYYPDEYEYEESHHLPRSYTYPYSDFCFAFKIAFSNQMILGAAEKVIKGPYPYWRRGFNSFWDKLSHGTYTAEDGIEAFVENCGTIDVEHGFRIRGSAYLPSIRLTHLNY